MHGECLGHERKLAAQHQVMPAGKAEQIGKHLTQCDVLEAGIVIAPEHAAHVRSQLVAPRSAARHSQGQQTLRQAVRVLTHPGRQQQQQLAPRCVVQCAHQAEVNDTDDAVASNQVVARMGIGVEVAMIENLLQHRAR